MLTPKHKGRGRWVVVDGDREVAGPFADKAAALVHIQAEEAKAGPESGAGIAKAKEVATALGDKKADFLATREYQRRLGDQQVQVREDALAEVLAVFTRHFGEDAASRATAELRQICADPKREARRRQRLREATRHGGQFQAASARSQ